MQYLKKRIINNSLPKEFLENHRNARGITLLVAAIAGLFLYVWGNTFLGKYSVCLYNHWLGIPCPFCGLTRAVFVFLHFRLMAAWAFNPLVYPLVMWFVLELGVFFWYNNIQWYTFLKIYRWILAGMVVLVFLLRCFRYFPLPLSPDIY